jgi:uncharacterized protein YukJ
MQEREMSRDYGILRGRVDRFRREDDFNTPHLQIKIVDAKRSPWRAAINILSSDQSRIIFHRADPLLDHPILQTLPHIKSGFTPMPIDLRSATTALDYVRAPLFDWAAGMAVPQTGPGAHDDLQDILIEYLMELQREDGEIYIFGTKYPAPHGQPYLRPIDREFRTRQGIHDIHMNQGDPPSSSFAQSNGVFQDGGLILRCSSRYAGLFLRFQTQWLPTDDDSGRRLPNARPVSARSV